MLLKDLVNATEKHLNITLGLMHNSSSSTITTWDGEEQRETVLNKNFTLINDAHCLNAYTLEPDEHESDNFRILINGSIFFTSPNITSDFRLLNPKLYCIAPNASNIYLHTRNIN